MRLPAPASALLTALVASIALAGCGSDEGSASDPAAKATPGESASASASTGASAKPSKAADAPVTVRLSVRGDTITPKAKVVKTKRGKPVVFVIDSDRAGSLHVHASPEQEPTFEKGTSRVSITLDMPGVVEVEEHEAGVLVAQIEVR